MAKTRVLRVQPSEFSPVSSSFLYKGFPDLKHNDIHFSVVGLMPLIYGFVITFSTLS